MSSHFYGAKFLRVLMNNWDWVFLLQVNFYKVLYNLFENKWCETHVQHQNVEKLCWLHLEFVSLSQNHNFHRVPLLHFYYFDVNFENCEN